MCAGMWDLYVDYSTSAVEHLYVQCDSHICSGESVSCVEGMHSSDNDYIVHCSEFI